MFFIEKIMVVVCKIIPGGLFLFVVLSCFSPGSICLINDLKLFWNNGLLDR